MTKDKKSDEPDRLMYQSEIFKETAATSNFSDTIGAEQGLELFGDGKSVQLYNRLKTATFFDGDRTWTEERDEEEGFQLENEEFVAALQEGRPPAQTAHDGIQATRIVLAADRAIRTGEVQELP